MPKLRAGGLRVKIRALQEDDPARSDLWETSAGSWEVRSIAEAAPDRIDISWSGDGRCFELRGSSEPAELLGVVFWVRSRYTLGQISEGRYSFVRWSGAFWFGERLVTVYDDSVTPVAEEHFAPFFWGGSRMTIGANTYRWRRGLRSPWLVSPEGKKILTVRWRSGPSFGSNSYIKIRRAGFDRTDLPLLVLAAAAGSNWNEL